MLMIRYSRPGIFAPPVLSGLRYCVILLLCLCVIGMNISEAKELAKGDPAPLITGKNAVSNGLFRLSSLMKAVGYKRNSDGSFKETNGKFVLEIHPHVVVLNFFSRTCIPCLKEIPAYNRVADHFRNDPVKLIYVNVEADITRQQARRFIASKQIRVPMMLPNQKEVIRKYNVVSLPRIIIIDRNGKIDHIINGFNDQLEPFLKNRISRLLAKQ